LEDGGVIFYFSFCILGECRNEDGARNCGHIANLQAASNSALAQGTVGDPHITTWANEHYGYHGDCGLVIMKDKELVGGLGLDIHIRIKVVFVHYWSPSISRSRKILVENASIV